jgi:hypothetical protein
LSTHMDENIETADSPETEAVEETKIEAVKVSSAADENAEVEQQMRRMSRRSFLWSAVAVGSTYTGWRWLISRREDDGIPWPFRRVLENNEALARDYFKNTRRAPTFAKTAISKERVNGDIGLGAEFDIQKWKLRVEGLASGEPLEITLKEIKALPRVEMITELKCIEGWSIVVQWAGARLYDFMKKYPPATKSGDEPDIQNKPDDLLNYVGMATPGGEYYVGLDRESALHRQTLLCYEMNGKPLTLEHGAPLRLVIPVKYGIKNIKRIGLVQYSDRRPKDYWAEQGYDWYSGL